MISSDAGFVHRIYGFWILLGFHVPPSQKFVHICGLWTWSFQGDIHVIYIYIYLHIQVMHSLYNDLHLAKMNTAWRFTKQQFFSMFRHMFPVNIYVGRWFQFCLLHDMIFVYNHWSIFFWLPISWTLKKHLFKITKGIFTRQITLRFNWTTVEESQLHGSFWKFLHPIRSPKDTGSSWMVCFGTSPGGCNLMKLPEFVYRLVTQTRRL